MNTPILKAALTAVALLLVAGCATTAKGPVTFAVPSAPSSTPPKKGNYTAAYAYAQDRMAATDYAEAAIYFGGAADWVPSPGTDGHVFEFENYVNASWASFLAGDKAGARRWLEKAKALDVQAAPSDRARYLDSLLTGEKQPALPPSLKSTLPW